MEDNIIGPKCSTCYYRKFEFKNRIKRCAVCRDSRVWEQYWADCSLCVHDDEDIHKEPCNTCGPIERNNFIPKL